MKHTIKSSLFAGVASVALGLTAVPPAFAQEMPGEGVTIDMARATWDTGWWQAEVYAHLLEELGYDVADTITTLDAPAFYQAVGQGDVDLWVNGWFPLHNTYIENFEQGAEIIGTTVENGALQGYLIDKKTADEHNISTMSDMAKDEIQELFDTNGDGKADMVACPPGWGCEETIAYHMEAYEWDDDFNLIKAGYSAGMADALGRYQAGEPIFFYTWTPNWTVGVLEPGVDVVWLEVEEVKLPEEQADLADSATVEELEGCAGEPPCVLGWPANDIRPVANSQFLEENPAAAALLESVQIPIEDIFAQNAAMNEGADSPEDLREQAATWIEENRDQVDEWLAAAREAAAN